MRLLALVREAEQAGVVRGRFARIAEGIERLLTAQKGGRPIPMNIDGATAVIYSELGFAPALGRGIFILSRSVGILAHAWEQSQQGGRIKGPMSPEIPYRYTGPAAPARSTRRQETMKQLISHQLVKYLEDRGVEYLFGLCGHTNIAVLAALKDSKIKFVNTRHEQIAAHIADGYARAKRTTAVVLSHLGPGLTNASTGVANAALDSIPMVVIAGDIPSHYYGKHPHQEVNLHADASQSEIYRPFVKRVWRVERPDLFPEIIEKAFQLAESGRPGPVLVSVPMDIFSMEVDTSLFKRLSAHTRALHKPSMDEPDRREDRARPARGQVAAHLRRRRRDPRRRRRRAARVRDPPRDPGRAHADGQGRAARRSPADARHDRLLGHQVRQRQVPLGRLDHRPRHALRGGRLQLVGHRVHVQHAADAS